MFRKYKEFIASDKWEKVRAAFFRKVGYRCQKCGATHNIQVHHMDYDDPNDLMAVCNRCHNVLHQDLECYGFPRLD